MLEVVMKYAQTLTGALLLTVCASAAMNPEIEKVLARFDELAARDLWPGFDARSVPLAIYDGEDTWLYRYPNPLPGFVASSADHVMVSRGRHPSIRANTSVDVSGMPTATAVLTGCRGPAILDTDWPTANAAVNRDPETTGTKRPNSESTGTFSQAHGAKPAGGS